MFDDESLYTAVTLIIIIRLVSSCRVLRVLRMLYAIGATDQKSTRARYSSRDDRSPLALFWLCSTGRGLRCHVESSNRAVKHGSCFGRLVSERVPSPRLSLYTIGMAFSESGSHHHLFLKYHWIVFSRLVVTSHSGFQPISACNFDESMA